jgi:hypothetical protein
MIIIDNNAHVIDAVRGGRARGRSLLITPQPPATDERSNNKQIPLVVFYDILVTCT